MKNQNRFNGSYFYIPFSVFKLGKRKRKLDYPTLIFHYGIGEWNTKGRYIQHVVVFRKGCLVTLFLFSIMKWKNGKRKDSIYTDPCYLLAPFSWYVALPQPRDGTVWPDNTRGSWCQQHTPDRNKSQLQRDANRFGPLLQIFIVLIKSKSKNGWRETTVRFAMFEELVPQSSLCHKNVPRFAGHRVR